MLKNDSDQVLALKEKSALSAQEHFMAVLSASATKRQRSIKQELNDVSFALQARAAIASLDVSKSEDSPVLSNGMNNLDATDEQSTTSPSQMSPKELDDLRKNLTIMRYQGMSDEELSTYCKGLLLDLQNATEHVHSIRKSTKRITERLMRFSSGTSEDKVEGRISVPLQKKLARHVDDFIAEIERNKTVFESTTNNDEYFDFLEAGYAKEDEVEGGLEAELQEIEAEWGDWSSDDYIWEPDHAGVHGPPRGVPKQNYLEDKDALEDEDDETLEEALERMDSEWSNWASDD